ncbi:hypothetical protein [Negativibacillus massiliensis]|uniref:hypothetical protein n=1 Tax=Negativibacillus massiliensis TaxID=1871035 RepID=UPI002A801195|nr:hypothetical protein [Negativibacillus massiliensis]MDY4046336.1 hypothetical protein [Negativibacillus massiliensis]
MNQGKHSQIVISLRKGCGQTSQLKGISGKSGILRLILKTKIFCVWINRSKKDYRDGSKGRMDGF